MTLKHENTKQELHLLRYVLLWLHPLLQYFSFYYLCFTFYYLCFIALCFAVHFHFQVFCYIQVCFLTFVCFLFSFACLYLFIFKWFFLFIMFVGNGRFSKWNSPPSSCPSWPYYWAIVCGILDDLNDFNFCGFAFSSTFIGYVGSPSTIVYAIFFITFITNEALWSLLAKQRDF